MQAFWCYIELLAIYLTKKIAFQRANLTRNSQHLMASGNSLPYSKHPATCPCPEPDESSPPPPPRSPPNIFVLYPFYFILPLYLGLTSGLFLHDSSTKPCIPVYIFVSFLSCNMPPLQFVLNNSTNLCCTGKESYNVLILR